MDAVGVAQWVILYMNDKPCILAGGPPGATTEQVLEQFRSAMLGSLPEGTKLAVKDLYDAPAEDVIRVGVVSLMSALSKIEGIMAQIVGQRGLLRH